MDILDDGMYRLPEKGEGREVFVRCSMAEGNQIGGNREGRCEMRDGAGVGAYIENIA